MEPVYGAFRRFAIDMLDPEQGEIPLPFPGGAHLAADFIAGSEVKAPYLGRRDINIVAAGQIVEGAQKTVTVGQRFQNALGVKKRIVPFRGRLCLCLRDFKNQFLLSQARIANQPGFPGNLVQFRQGFGFQFFRMQFFPPYGESTIGMAYGLGKKDGKGSAVEKIIPPLA